MRRELKMALALSGLCLGGCESLPEGALGDIGKDVFGNVMGTAAGSASARMIQNTADSMCSSSNVMCRNLTVVAMSGFTEAFIKQLSQSDVRRINEARDKSIATGEEQSWENPETGAFGIVASQPAEPRPPEPMPVKVKKDRVASLPMMDAVGEPFSVSAGGGANVRGGPGTDYEVVDRLENGERVRGIGKVRDEDWYLVGRGNVGIGYVFGELLQPWQPPEGQPLEETMPAEPEAPADDVAEVEVEMAAECFSTTQKVTLASGTTEEATVTSCRTPDGWVTV